MLRTSYAVAARPFPGERESGDRAVALPLAAPDGAPGGLLLALIDGAGHGPAAHAAALAAERYLDGRRGEDIGAALGALHRTLRGTRGAVAALARLDLETGALEYGGVGNIEGRLVRAAGASARLLSASGLLGMVLPRVRTVGHVLAPGDLLVLHSDGVSAGWDPARYPGLLAEPAAFVAAVLLRDWGRQTDDATVLVVRCEDEPAERGDE